MDSLTVESPKITLLGMPIHAVRMCDVLEQCERAIVQRRSLILGMVNVAKLVNSRTDGLLYESVAGSDLIAADGQGVVWLSRLAGKPLPERIAGVDVMMRLMELAHRKRYRVYFLGAKPNVVEQVVQNARSRYPDLEVAGSMDGYFDLETEGHRVALEISRSRPDILFVAITPPKKELFMSRWATVMSVPVCHGVGGSFDVFAGRMKRAPLWMQRGGLEWFYRIAQEPRRMWRRYLVTNSVFLFLSIREIVAGRRSPVRRKKTDAQDH